LRFLTLRIALAGALLLVLTVGIQRFRNAEAVSPEPKTVIALSRAAPMPGRVQQFDDPDIRSVLDVRHKLKHGEFVWNDAGIPAGPAWIRIDLAHQIISVFRSGHEIGTAVITYGAGPKPTPVGEFRILSRLKAHQSSIYDADMPYTLRLTNDGVSIHGGEVRPGTATHGCIGVPLAFARQLFDQVRVGDKVMVLPPA